MAASGAGGTLGRRSCCRWQKKAWSHLNLASHAGTMAAYARAHDVRMLMVRIRETNKP